MASSECIDCSLWEFVFHWMLTAGPFWTFLGILLYWYSKTNPSSHQDGGQNFSRQLASSLKSRKDADICFANYVILLGMELIEGYWLIAWWWQCAQSFWTWDLKKDEWFLQFWQLVILLVLGIALVFLLLFGVAFLTITKTCLTELWRWELQGSEDNWQLVQGDEDKANDQGEEEGAKEAKQTAVSASTSAISMEKQKK